MGSFRSLPRRIGARLSARGEGGASAVEYGIMIAMIAAVVLIAVLFLGSETSRTFSCTADTVSTSSIKC